MQIELPKKKENPVKLINIYSTITISDTFRGIAELLTFASTLAPTGIRDKVVPKLSTDGASSSR